MKNKKRNLKGFILLFVVFIIIKLFLAGPYLYHFWEELLLIIIILTIVSLIMMLVPIIFRLINKKRIDYVKGKKICILNSLVLFIIFSIPNIFTILKGTSKSEVMSFNPILFAKQLIMVSSIIAFIYYFINMFFWVDNKS